MTKMIKYPKTPQFRYVVRDVQHKATFVGIDENGEPTFDGNLTKPTIVFTGTVKIHGTNAGVSFNGTDMWVQSRNNVIDSLTGHMGFAEFVHNNKEWIREAFSMNHVEGSITTMYGEWAGPGIQNGVGVSSLPNKMWFVFGVKITPPEGDAYWLESYDLPKTRDRIYDIHDFNTWSVPIDFERPETSVKMLTEITEGIEKECPVAKMFGISGVGEGAVWSGWYKEDRHIFKVKGEKHSSSKVKTLAQVDPEKMQSVYDFVDYAATDNRVTQAMQEVSEGDLTSLTKKSTPDVLRWIANDIISEESDVLQENNIAWNDVAKHVTDRARRIFFDKLEKTF